MRMRDHIHQAAVMASALVMAAALCGCEKKAAAKTEPSVAVRAELPVKMTFQDKIRLQGNVEPKEYADVCARTDGTIYVMKVEEGDAVKPGQLLFQSDKIQLESQVEVARQQLKVAETQEDVERGKLAIAEATWQKAKKDYERSAKLVKVNAIAQSTYETDELLQTQAELNVRLAKAAVNAASAQVEQARSNLSIAQKYYEDSLIRAPFDAVVTDRYKEMGEYAKKGDKVLRLEQPDQLEIALLLSSKYYPRVVEGKTTVVIYAEDGTVLSSVPVSYRSPVINSSTRTFEIKITLVKQRKLVSGMLCDVDLILAEKEGYGVPTEAVLPRGGERFAVFTPKAGVAHELKVTPGLTDKGFTELVGLKDPAHTAVVCEGQGFINEGSSVTLANETK